MRQLRFILPACGLAALVLGQTHPASGGTEPFDLISEQAVSYVSEARFPENHPQLYPDHHENALASQTVGDIHVLLLAGPQADMMSFRSGTLTNPELRIARGSRVILSVMNVDDDMVHDLAIVSRPPPYAAQVGAGAIRTARLPPYRGKRYAGAVLILKAARRGVAYYVCTVPGHAQAGMYGKIVVQ